MNPFKLSAFAIIAAFTISACGKAPAGFSVSGVTSGQGNGCTAGSTTKKLRILVMVDNSGSTASTDPDQYYRVETLRNFLAVHSASTNLSYGFGYFGDDAFLYDMNLGRFIEGSVSSPVGGHAGITGALDAYHALSPSGNTGYTAAFDALRSAITRDESTGNVEDYAVVFMSDGQPTDITGNVTTGIANLVDALKSAAGANGRSHVAISSVYFGSASDSTSIGNLRGMANRGGGQFVDTNNLPPGGLSIDDVVTVPGCI